ncbi:MULTISPECIES: thioesterase family protein [Arthrobacter]|uniref:Thioesterase n=1 Tax=Arthrobacter terricola TaxID=2547396 RepID=A0A4V6PIJ9_9MICC|nr:MULTISPECIES: thioesterase family protein [Arthrobacter]TDF99144.1 thioesterase [Arthrobacter terricola]
MSAKELAVGLKHTEYMTVEERHTVPAVEPRWPGFADMPPVFATAMMVGFIEQTCVEALRPFLGEGEHTVGTHVDISHVAATPVGMEIAATVELVSVEARTLHFRVFCLDEEGLIGEGNHQRVIINTERFMARVGRKADG